MILKVRSGTELVYLIFMISSFQTVLHTGTSMPVTCFKLLVLIKVLFLHIVRDFLFIS